MPGNETYIVNKAGIKTCGNFVETLWQSFFTYNKNSQRIDIVFDHYLSNSAKAWSMGTKKTG